MLSTVTVISVIKGANKILEDVFKVRWPEAELLGWYNEALLEIVNKRPDALVATKPFPCVLGTLQELPSNALRFIKALRNEASKFPITPIEIETLNELNPAWHDESNVYDDVEHYVYDNRDPKHFFIFPVVHSEHSILLSYSYAPKQVAIANFETDEQVIEIDDTYKAALMDWILYRAFSKNATHNVGAARARSHYSAFYQSLGIKLQSDTGISINSASEA